MKVLDTYMNGFFQAHTLNAAPLFVSYLYLIFQNLNQFSNKFDTYKNNELITKLYSFLLHLYWNFFWWFYAFAKAIIA